MEPRLFYQEIKFSALSYTITRLLRFDCQNIVNNNHVWDEDFFLSFFSSLSVFVFILFVRWFFHFSDFDGVWSLFGRSQFFCTCFQQWNVKQIELLRFFGALLCSISVHIYSSLSSLIAFLFSVHRLASKSINGLSKVTFRRSKWKDFISPWIERKEHI